MTRILMLIACVLGAAPALAAEPPALGSYSLSNDDVVTIGKALADQPYKLVADLLTRLQVQFDAVNRPPPAAPPAKPEDGK